MKQLNRLITEINYKGEIERQYKTPLEKVSRWSSVEELVNATSQYERGAEESSLEGFLEEIALTNNEDEVDKDQQLKKNAVALITLHSAKGLEFPQVYMVGMEEGLFPHHRSIKEDGAAIDEERRLCYVGVTRAQDRLSLSMALTRMKWGKPRETHPSRFLFELTGVAEQVGPDKSRKPRRRATARRR